MPGAPGSVFEPGSCRWPLGKAVQTQRNVCKYSMRLGRRDLLSLFTNSAVVISSLPAGGRRERGMCSRASRGVPHPWFSRVRVLTLSSIPLRRNRSESALHPARKNSNYSKAILRMFPQFPLHRVSVHIVQLLSQFFLAPHIEVIESPLPQRWRINGQQLQCPTFACGFFRSNRDTFCFNICKAVREFPS